MTPIILELIGALTVARWITALIVALDTPPKR